MGKRASAVRVALAGASVVVALGCGSAESTGSSTPGPSVVKVPDADASVVPSAPQGDAVLTITGRIAGTNGAGALTLDQAQLDRLGLLAVSVEDPWAKKRIDVQGVWLRDLVGLARPDAGATSLRFTALDDYQIDLTLAEIRAEPVFLATRTGAGGALPVEDGGPTRVVFTDDVAGRFSPDQGIWNIETIEVR